MLIEIPVRFKVFRQLDAFLQYSTVKGADYLDGQYLLTFHESPHCCMRFMKHISCNGPHLSLPRSFFLSERFVLGVSEIVNMHTW